MCMIEGCSEPSLPELLVCDAHARELHVHPAQLQEQRRARLAGAAQTAAILFDSREPGSRVVVVVTDESGDWVGVGSNTTFEDVLAILRCALAGDDLLFHTTKEPGAR